MSTNLSLDVANQLLDKLSSDDDFRQQFVSDPEAALRSLGPRAASFAAASACMKVDALASKDAIAASRKALTKMLATQLSSMNIPDLRIDQS